MNHADVMLLIVAHTLNDQVVGISFLLSTVAPPSAGLPEKIANAQPHLVCGCPADDHFFIAYLVALSTAVRTASCTTPAQT